MRSIRPAPLILLVTTLALLALSGAVALPGTAHAQTETPVVTIAADQTAFTAELDAVTFTLTRTGSTAAALTADVVLTQDQEFLQSVDLTRSVAFQSGESTAALELLRQLFVGHEVTVDGMLTATVQEGTGYVLGTEKAASASILVTSPAVTVRLEEASYTFDEGAASPVVALVATTASGVPSPNRSFQVSVSALRGTARSPDDYENLTDFPTFQPSDFGADGAVFTARVEVPLTLVDDALDEPDESFTMALQKAPGTTPVVELREHDDTACVPVGLCSVTATITDNDPTPTLSVAPAQAEEGESLTFTVTLSAESGREVTVDWTANAFPEVGDSATAGTDFTAGTGTLTFAPRTTEVDQVSGNLVTTSGETAKTFTVSTTEDETFEPNETFTVALSNPSNAEIGGRTKGTILNDDPATLVSNIGQSTDTQETSATYSQRFTTGSNAGGYTLTSVDMVSDGTRGFGAKVCGVDSSGYPTSACTDLTPPGIFAAGTLSFTARPNITLTKDTTYAVVMSPTGGLADIGVTTEDGEDMGFVAPWNIANAFDFLTTSADAAWQTHSSRSMRIAIKGTAILPTLSIANATGTEGGNVTFTVTLSEEAEADVTATWTASIVSGDTAVLADDLGTTTGELTVSMGELMGTFDVPTTADDADEEDETFTVTLTDVSSNALIAEATAEGTINDDDDLPVVSAVPVNAEVTEGESVIFTLTLSPASGKRVVVPWGGVSTAEDTATPGLDFPLTEGDLLYFEPGETSKTLTLHTTDDLLDEEDEETFSLALRAGINVTYGAGDIHLTVPATILDNDAQPTLSVNDVSAGEGGDLTFTVTLSAVSGRDVTVDWEAAARDDEGDDAEEGTDFAAASGTLTFARAGVQVFDFLGDLVSQSPGETEKTFTVSTTDDSVDEAEETFTVTLSNPTNATFADATAKGTITSDDTPAVTGVPVTSEPALTSPGETTPDTYGFGETIEVSVTFSAPVNAATGTDLVLSVGGAKRATAAARQRHGHRWCSATPCRPATRTTTASGWETRTGRWSATAMGLPRTARSRARPPGWRRPSITASPAGRTATRRTARARSSRWR